MCTEVLPKIELYENAARTRVYKPNTRRTEHFYLEKKSKVNSKLFYKLFQCSVSHVDGGRSRGRIF